MGALDSVLFQSIENALNKQVERVVDAFGLGRCAISDQIGENDAVACVDKRLHIAAKVRRARRSWTASMKEDDRIARPCLCQMNFMTAGYRVAA